MLHPYLPTTATSLQRPVNSVPWVAVAERFNCIIMVLHTALLPADKLYIITPYSAIIVNDAVMFVYWMHIQFTVE